MGVLSRSHDSLRVIERLRSLRDQHAKDLEQDMDEKQTAATRSQIKKWKLEEKAGKAKSDAAFPAGNVAHVAAKESVAS